LKLQTQSSSSNIFLRSGAKLTVQAAMAGSLPAHDVVNSILMETTWPRYCANSFRLNYIFFAQFSLDEINFLLVTTPTTSTHLWNKDAQLLASDVSNWSCRSWTLTYTSIHCPLLHIVHDPIHHC
jgi:hypothetical protein